MPSIELPIKVPFMQLPIELVVRETIAGVFSGSGSLTRPAGPIGVDAFGITWDFFTVPAGFGSTPGNPTQFENRMLQLGVVHQDLGTHQYYSEFHDFTVEGIYLMFSLIAPVRVDYTIAPGVEVSFFWLVL